MENFNISHFMKDAVNKGALFLAMALTTAFVLANLAGQAHAANLIVNPGFETNPPTTMANNIGWSVAPWILGGGGSSNVVQVDGPGGYDYYSNGPESDGSAPGAGIAQHYLDIANGSNNLYQSFTVPACPASPAGTSVTVLFSGKFSTRSINIGYPSGPVANGKIQILSGTGTSGSVIASQSASLMAGPSKTSPWLLLSGSATVAHGSTFSYVVTMDDNVNFDDAVVTIEADPCDPIQTGSLKIIKDAQYNGQHIANQSFPIVVNCAGTMTNAAVSDGTPVVIPNIPVGTNCSVVEGTITTPAGLCPTGATPQWTTTYVPSTPVVLTAAGASITIRNVLDCQNVQPPQNTSCLKATPDVSCGATLGTYTITLHPQGVNGIIPSVLQVSTTTPGISLVPANASILVTGGVAHVTVVGATPGQAISLDVAGTAIGQGSSQGIDQCCNGKVEIVIPKDLDCDKDKIDIAIHKIGTTSPALDVSGYSFDLKMTNEGKAFTAAPGQVSVTERVPAGMKFTVITPSAGWACSPAAPITGPANLICTYAGGPIAAGPNATIGTIKITAQNLNPAPFADVENCADIGFASGGSAVETNLGNNKSCVIVSKKPPVIKVEKICDPAIKSPGDLVVTKWEAACHIKITTTGSVSGPLNISEVFGPSGTVSYTGSSTSDPWACAPVTATAPAPMNCTLPGNSLNPVSDVTIIDVKVVFPTMGAITESKNCATPKYAGEVDKKSCAPFTKDDGSIKITKICDPTWINQPSNGMPYPKLSLCHITVTTTGAQTGTVSFGDTMTGGTLPNNLISLAGNASGWVCAPSGCSIPGANLNQTSSTSGFISWVGFGAGDDPLKAKNCAKINGASGQNSEVCVPFTNGGGHIEISKIVVNHTQANLTGMLFDIDYNCGSGNAGTVHLPPNNGYYHISSNGTCTVQEQTAPLPSTNPCPAGQSPQWSTAYIPGQTVSVPTGLVVITVQNTLDCKPIVTGTITINKVCDPASWHKYPVSAVATGIGFVSNCHITVTTTGPQTGTISVNDVLSGTGTLVSMNSTNAPFWDCTSPTPSCNIFGSILDQTSSTSTFNATVVFANSGNALEAQNCAKVAVNQAEAGKSCVKFTVDEVKPKLEIVKTGLKDCQAGVPCPFTISITSLGQPYSGNILLMDVLTPNLAWPVTSITPNICGGVITTMPFNCVANVNLVANTPLTFTVTLNPLTTNALSQNENCISAAFVGSTAPVGPISMADIQALHNANQLSTPVQSCWKFTEPPQGVSTLTVMKEAIYNGQHITNQSFPIAVTCGGSTTNSTVIDGSPYVQTGIAVGTSCSVVENTSNLPNLCPAGTSATPLWGTSYVPTTPVVVTAGGATIIIKNQLLCGDLPPAKGINVKKVVINNAELPLGPMQFSIQSNCAGGPTPNMTQTLADGETKPFQTYTSGASCVVSEDPPGPTNACGHMIPRWTTTYLPSATVSNFANGSTIVVQNTLDCDCPNGHKLVNGTCNAPPRPPVVVTTPVDTPPKCDAATATPAGDLCRCRFSNMSPVSKTECQCNKGFKLEAGQGCLKIAVRPVCKPPQIYNPATNTCITPRPVCLNPQVYDANSNRCVTTRPRCDAPQVYNPATNSCITPRPICKKPQVYDANSNRCITPRPVCRPPQIYNPATNSCITPRPVCHPPQVYNPKRNACMDVKRECPQGTLNIRGNCIPIPHCKFPQIPVPGTGLCVNIGGGSQPKGEGNGVPRGEGGGGLQLPGIKLPGL